MRTTAIKNTFPINTYNASRQTKTTNSSFAFALNQAMNCDKTAPSMCVELFWKDEVESYSDEKLAERLQQEDGPKISTEKKINWKADGRGILTSEQIKVLKESYNLSDMSSQDYYNLLSDLSNMNVLSGKDIVKIHAGVAPGREPGVYLPEPHSINHMHDKNMFSGNIYQKILTLTKDLSYTLKFADDYYPNASNGGLEYKDYYEDQLCVRKNFLSILKQIV